MNTQNVLPEVQDVNDLQISKKSTVERGKSEQRKYPVADVKILYARAAGRCAFAKCRKNVILPDISGDKSRQIGKIAHIIAHSDNGPRADKSYPSDKLDSYDNWILLCPSCHELIDTQPFLYTSENLRKIKQLHEKWVEEGLDQANVTFAELEIAAKAIASGQHYDSNGFLVISPEEKIKKNNLTTPSIRYITMGLSRGPEVENFLEKMAHIDCSFPERLKDSFKHKYIELRQISSGDELFMNMYLFATAGLENMPEEAAGLAILVHLFHLCEIFEK